MAPEAIIQPMFAMALLTIVMTVWMFLTRIPAMNKLRVDPQEGQDTRHLRTLLPHSANRVANNYNHLFEQPVVFYATCIAIAVLGHTDQFFVTLAWIYVLLRIGHSLVQATRDIVMARFTLFLASWLVLAIMIIRESFALF